MTRQRPQPWRRRGSLAASLVGVVLCATLWIVSYWNMYYMSPQAVWGLARGGVSYLTFSFVLQPGDLHTGGGLTLQFKTMQWEGFRGLSTSWLPVAAANQYYLPMWIPTALSGAVALAVVRRVRRDRLRRQRHQCVGCGYALAGLSTPRCPECGAAY